jgi:hypothetical protein
MKKHLRTVGSVLAALGLVAAALSMSTPAMAGTSGGKCTRGMPDNPCATTGIGNLLTSRSFIQDDGNRYYSLDQNNPASTSKNMYFGATDQAGHTIHGMLPPGTSGTLPQLVPWASSICGFDVSCQ